MLTMLYSVILMDKHAMLCTVVSISWRGIQSVHLRTCSTSFIIYSLSYHESIYRKVWSHDICSLAYMAHVCWLIFSRCSVPLSLAACSSCNQVLHLCVWWHSILAFLALVSCLHLMSFVGAVLLHSHASEIIYVAYPLCRCFT